MRAPTFNLEAEQAVLGAVLFSNKLLSRLPPLKAGDFYDDVHGVIWNRVVATIERGQVADGIRLKEFFERTPAIQELGGAAYLTQLMSAAAPLNSQAIDAANVIIELSARRMLIAIGNDLVAQGIAPKDGVTPVEAAMIAERELQAIGARGGGREVGLREAGQRVVDGLSKPYRGLSTGIGELDALIGGLIAPDLIILAGRPGMGKTSLAVNIAVNVALSPIVDEYGAVIRYRVVAFFSMEMSAEQLAARALSRKSKEKGAMAFGYSSIYAREFRPRADAVSPFVSMLPERLRIDDGAAQNVAHIRATCRDIRSRYGALDLVVVDYLQLCVDPSARKDGRVQEVTAITAGLKGLAKEMSVPVLALSQLSRQVEGRLDKTPQNSDLRESGSIEQDADIILFAYREHYYLTQSEPQVREGETRDDFDSRKAAWQRRKQETQNIFTAICGKRRNGPVGIKNLECDLAHDVICDPSETDSANPRQPYWARD